MIDTEIDVEVPDVAAYRLWRRFEDFPKYFRTVQRVTHGPDGLMHWTVEILGVERSFDVRVTEEIEGKRLAWASVDGAEHAGVVTFHRLDDTSCRVKLQMEFEPHGLLEQLADATQLTRLAVDYELGEFKAIAEASSPTGDPII
jgi:uncharacterized membrane protein